MDKSYTYNKPDEKRSGYENTAQEYWPPHHCHKDLANLDPAPLMRSERAELLEAIASEQRQLKNAQRQIEILQEKNACLKQKIIRIAKKYADTRRYGSHDELTGLPTRSFLRERLKQTIVLATCQQRQVGILFIDLDKFKNVNDTWGHAAGDKLLQEVAQRLRVCIRHGDTACRYGGDEFVVLLRDIDGYKTALAVAEKIRTCVAGPYVIEGHVLDLTVSIGTSVVPAEGQNCEDLINQADMAMYVAKAENSRVNPV
ncbi:Diguanylate cyclase (GGDEF)-like protein [Candidatus Methylobacter favarea]|uniref:Diguanylate cyclase (GGDEF)-like protein n=1 Tax=Candidatus Methylobacter favarea TaxID=2707345 RepID=A0A8S0Y6Y3_9GAMM|nr:GGDEF domain-containing protein [Candidatus Methylobacter favarea]CAA9892459.1 Diguanylate cyclase (GGDEF)-like protein [Candidatus Methylobacter favarea]